MAETPFKLRSGNTTPFKQMGSTPAKHYKDGSWRGHEHKSILGKMTGKAADALAGLETDIEDIGLDVASGKTLGTTKKEKAAKVESDKAAADKAAADKAAKAAADKAAADKAAADKLAAKEKQAATDKGKFGAAFRTARDEHGGKGGTFTWRGSEYHTGTTSEEE